MRRVRGAREVGEVRRVRGGKKVSLVRGVRGVSVQSVVSAARSSALATACAVQEEYRRSAGGVHVEYRWRTTLARVHVEHGAWQWAMQN